MTRKTLIAAVSSLALTWCGVAWAQQAGATTDQQPMQSEQHRDHAGAQAQERSEAQHGKLMLKKADEVIGKEVVNPQGEKLGHIRELAIDGKTGQVAYAVLEFDKLTNLRDKLFAVPWTALKTKAQTDRANQPAGQAAEDRTRAGKEQETWYTDKEKEGAQQFVLNVSKEKLESAPGFNRDKWPDMANPEWGAEVHKFYNEKPYWEGHGRQGHSMRERTPGAGAGVEADQHGARVEAEARSRDHALEQGAQTPGQTTERPGQEGQRMILKAENQLIGKNVYDTQGQNKIGKLENLMIDRRTGTIAFVVVKMDKVEGDKDMAALPWNQIDWKWNEADKKGTIALKTDVNQIKPNLFAKNSWPDLSNREYAAAIYRQFNARPYWEMGSEDVLGFQE